MIRDIKDTPRSDDDRLFLVVLQQILKKFPFASAMKFISQFLCLYPHLRHSDGRLGRMQIGALIDTGSRVRLFLGYLLGSVLMLAQH